MKQLALGAALIGALALPAAAQADSLTFIRGGHVWISHTDGSAARQVTDHEDTWQWPSQADDGTLFVAGGAERVNQDGTDSDGADRVVHMDQYGTVIGPAYVETPGSHSTPSCPTYSPTSVRVSPDGQRVAFNDYFCDNVDAFIETLADGHFKMLSEDYHTSTWQDANNLLITHNGPEFGNATYAVYELANPDASHGPDEDPYLPEKTAVAARDNTRVAVYEDDPLISGTGVATADIRVMTTEGNDVHHPVEKCTIPIPAANAERFTFASPSLSPDGTRLTWAEKDGVHTASTANLDDCSTVTNSLLVPGGSEPFIGPAEALPAREHTDHDDHVDPPPPPGTFTITAATARAKVTKTGGLLITLVSQEAATATISGTVGRSTARIKPQTAALGARTAVPLQLSHARALRRTLKHHARKLVLTVTATAANGDTASQQLTIRLAR